jgi:hypothetical protein
MIKFCLAAVTIPLSDKAHFNAPHNRINSAIILKLPQGKFMPEHIISGPDIIGQDPAKSVDWLKVVFSVIQPEAQKPVARSAPRHDDIEPATPLSASICKGLAWLSLIGGFGMALIAFLGEGLPRDMRAPMSADWFATGIVSLGVFLALADIVESLAEIRRNTRR